VKRDKLKAEWKQARDAGTFLTPKHDPNGPPTWHFYRTVLTHEVSASLDEFLDGDKYDLEVYENARRPYIVITPHSGAFSVTASGILSGSLTASHDCDRLVVVSGSASGWHTFGESTKVIEDRQLSGSLTFKTRL
jgi:hypothetical protein